MNEIMKEFKGNQIRIIEKDGMSWFVAKDVCDVLEIKNNRQTISYLDEDEKGVITNDTPSGKQEMGIVNEAGLYSLVLRSRKPEAKAFKRWVCWEVLPSIRKTGVYAPQNRTMETVTKVLSSLKKQFDSMTEENGIMRQQLDYLRQFAPKTLYGTKAPNGGRRTTIRRGSNVAGNGRVIEYRNPDEVGYQMDLFSEYLPRAVFNEAVTIININCPNLLTTNS